MTRQVNPAILTGMRGELKAPYLNSDNEGTGPRVPPAVKVVSGALFDSVTKLASTSARRRMNR